MLVRVRLLVRRQIGARGHHQPLGVDQPAAPARVALGHAVLHQPRVVIEDLIAEDIPKERRRIEEAVAQLRAAHEVLYDPALADQAARLRSECAAADALIVLKR